MSSNDFTVEVDRVDAVVFDLGGVLIEGGPGEVVAFGSRTGLSEDAWRGLRREMFGNDSTWAKLERGEVTFDAFAQELMDKVNAAGGNIDFETATQFMGRPKPMGAESPIRPAMIDAVRRLRKLMPTALLTNNVKEWREGWSAQFDDPELFSAVIDSSAVGARKPEAPIYEHTREQLALPHDRILFVDDIGQNLKAAHALGWQTLLFVDENAVLEVLNGVIDHAAAR